jgi:hypothetical protein
MPKIIRTAVATVAAIAVACVLFACAKAAPSATGGEPHRFAAASSPFARLQVSVNTGGYETGLVYVAPSATIQLVPASTLGITQWLWEIYDYPIGFTLPTGWSYEGTPGQSPMAYSGGYFPPSFSIPAQATPNWGPFMLRLRVNGNPLQYTTSGTVNQGFNPSLTDESTILKFPSPAGLEGIGFNESTQGDPLRSNIGTLMRMFRDIDQGISAGNVYGGLHQTLTSITLDGGPALELAFASVDTAGANVDAGSNAIQVSAAADVFVVSSLAFNASASTQIQFQIYKNGSGIAGSLRQITATAAADAGYLAVVPDALSRADAGDVYSVWASSVASTTLNYEGSLVVATAGARQGPPGPAGAGGGTAGGGAPFQTIEGGAITTLGSVGSVTQVDLAAGSDTTLNLGTVVPSPNAGDAYQFDLVGAAGIYSLQLSGGPGFLSISQGNTVQSSVSFSGPGQSIVIKYSSKGYWITP